MYFIVKKDDDIAISKYQVWSISILYLILLYFSSVTRV